MGKSSGSRAARQAAQIQANAATQVANTQSAAQLEAAGMSSAAALEAANIAASGSHAIAGATSEAAHLSANATRYSADLQAQAAARALAEQARQYNQTVERFQPYVDLGNDSISAFDNASTIQGYDDRLGQIFDSSNFGALRKDRQEVADDYSSRIGLTRSGAAIEQASDISTGLGREIENQLYGRLGNNVGVGQNSVAQVGAFGQNYANAVGNIETGTAANIGNLTTQGAATQGNFLVQGAQAAADGQNALAQGILNSGNAQAQGLLGSQQSLAQGVQSAADARSTGLIQGAQADAQQSQNVVNTALTAAAIFFSDERLKENMEYIGSIKGLPLYEWDWKDEYKGVMGAEMSTGFKAQDVEKVYPDCVYDINGIKAINYPEVQVRLAA
ncbi:tail fiber domain-containing protein [Planktomarina sp.]|uniref:tail fiber domain-containing protein n=1 Tax=Planktomarina sp. TaxID=2024851 RepID=UPI0032609CAE